MGTTGIPPATDGSGAKAMVGETGRQSRFAQWDMLGVDRVKHDLLNGGFRLVGGPPEVRKRAWEGGRTKEREVDEKREVFQLKPTLWGMSIDIKRLWEFMLKPFIKRYISR